MRPFLLALFVLPLFVKAQAIADKADALLTAYADQQKFSGAVLIAKEGKIVFEKAYGYADRNAQRLNTVQTEFRVGSLTKMFTSTVILQLAAESKLSLADPVSKYVPGFANGKKIQLIHLLSHTSGIKGHTESPEPQTLEQSVARFKTETPAFQPGAQFEYNNFNYILLSYIAQKVTGIPYPQLVKERVLDKAGMTHSGLDKTDRKSEQKALGYVTNPETAAWQEANAGNVALASGAGALYSTVEDLYRWSQAVAKKTVLPETTLAKAMKPVLNNYGLGWMTSKDNGHVQVGHTGSIPGFIANFMRFPQEDVTIVFLSNYQDLDGRQLTKDLSAVVFGNQYALPVKKQAVVLPAAVLQRYAGEYKLPNGFGITVTVTDNRIYALAQGDQSEIELTPESEKKFFLKGPETTIEFIEEDGAVKYMFVDLQGGQKFTKVK